MEQTPIASPLWDFALAAYAQPGVAQLCLDIQDRHGANVMLMLHLCHCARAGGLPESVADAALRMEPLERHLVSPLRHARRALSGAASALGSETLRAAARQLQRAELAAESLQCLRVDAPVGRGVDAAAARAVAEQALGEYFLLLGPASDWQRHCAASMAAAVFPG